MYSPPDFRQIIPSIPWREHSPSAITVHLDRASTDFQRRFADHESELRNLDATFGTVAKVLVLAWVIDRCLAPAWRHVWARGIFGSIVELYKGVRDVSHSHRIALTTSSSLAVS